MTIKILPQYTDDYTTKFEKYKCGPTISDLDIDIENVRYQHLPVFMKFLSDDEILLCIKYYRYHDFENYGLIDVYWNIHKQYFAYMGKKDKLTLRENMSLFKALLTHFMDNQDICYDKWFTLVQNELLAELSLRIKWEESKLLNAIITHRKNNKYLKTDERMVWQNNYIKYEENARKKWYANQIDVIKNLENIILNIRDFERIKSENLNIPLLNNDIYNNDRYEYLFNLNLNKIRMINGLYTIVENDCIVTTSKINKICPLYSCVNHSKNIISYKSIQN